MIASLTRILGPAQLGLAEDAVQEALVRALELWPFQGIPENPQAWLMTVARNRALDFLRREKLLETKAGLIAQSFAAGAPGHNQFADDRLAMMFLCCHPALARDVRVALTLKSVTGFGVAEIARAFLTPAPTIAQRLVRAKRLLRDESIVFAMPAGQELEDRLDSVLEVIYLIFNEGYLAHSGEALIRKDLCDEAIFLGRLIADNPLTRSPRCHALLALMLLASARLASRQDALGKVLLFEQQDRAQWDHTSIALGMLHLEFAAQGEQETEYHLEAAIAASHYAEPVDWPFIVVHYDRLLELKQSPVVMMNRAVAVAKMDGPEAGIRLLEEVEDHPRMRGYYLLPAVIAELYIQAGDRDKARLYLGEALACECTVPERRRLESRMASLA